MIFYAWFFIIIKQIVNKKKISLLKDLRSSFKIAAELIGLYLLLFVIAAGLFAIIVLLFLIVFGAFSISAIIGIPLAIIATIISLLIAVLFYSTALYAPVILIYDKLDIKSAIKKTYRYVLRRKSHCIIMSIIFGGIMLIASQVNNAIISLFINETELELVLIQASEKYVIASLPGIIITTIVFFWLYLFFFYSYKYKR